MAQALAVILVAALAAGALVAPVARQRAGAMLGALAVTPILLVAHVWDTSAFHTFKDHPPLLAVAAVAGGAVVLALAAVFDRHPSWFGVAAVAMVPFRIPIAVGGSTSNLLVPLYVVIGAGALAYALPRLRASGTFFGGPPAAAPSADTLAGVLAPAPEAARRPEHPAQRLEWLLAATLVLYALQATYSSDAGHALENVVFFYVPFALLFVLLGRITWTAQLVGRCLTVLAGLALAFAGIGFVEYATKHVFLNPRVITSNQLESYFRVNSLFFDPNIYGRFLMVVMLGLAGTVLWARTQRTALAATAVLVVLWAGLVLTFSQSSFVSMLVGLTVLGGLRWDPRKAGMVAGVGVVLALGVALLVPSVRFNVSGSKSADTSTSGRYDLIRGGLDLFKDAPLTGQGAGAFAKDYRRTQKSSSETSASASHTIPITVAAEQGIVGLALYLALLAAALSRLFKGAVASVPRAIVAAAFVALVVHTFMYAAFLEDPLTWTLLGIGVALARVAPGTPDARARSEARRAAAAAAAAQGA
ncbi:O-antigen ligase family protein [Paraconexibacter antarcticus]|uniref:O-antigen ligase family protein n=1 Tax=Paraconexibacter antarcticus TaxID=2949664 RepID=A0ABY5DSZ3_9ACTN|nr:O-antigen ligase family protein [Paraconexibacter antarcticus]UTI64714.1 O-antigen ligase family protein [Paraconexibacter antarcticus]